MSMEEWKEYRIGELCRKVCSGGTPKSTIATYYDGEIPWLNTKEVAFNRIYHTERYITQEGLDNSSAKWIDKNAVIVAMYGATAGKCAITKIPLTTNQACCNLMIDENKADYRFVYYALCNDYVRLASLANGGAQQNLNAQQIKDFDIPYPPLPTQQKIANILSSLDDKIEVNRRINEQLEELAQALFKSWFVDFEPFKDGAFVDSELGMIPEGWKVRRLDEVSKLIAGGDKPNIVSSNKTDDTPYPIYSNGIDNYGLYGYSDNYRIKEESVTVSARGTIGYVCLREEPYTPIVRLISIIPNADSVSAKFIYHSLKIKPIQGTGTTQQQLTVPMFRNTLLVVPPQEVMGSFTLKADSFFALRRKNQQEIHHLTTLRDTLLPKLMSGEIDVSEVEV